MKLRIVISGMIKGNFSKIEKFYRFCCIVAKVKLAVTREISGFPLKKCATLMVVFSVLLDMSQSIFSYLVSRKMKVYSDVWLLKRQTCVFGLKVTSATKR